MLGLQRSAGNQAVARFLQTCRGSAPHGRVLARFALTVTTRSNNGNVLIDKVRIGGRPPGLFGAEHKSHTVGWETFCDGLRYEVMGQSPDVALQRVEALYQLALLLPSMARRGHLGQRPKSDVLHTAASTRATTAHNDAAPMIATPNNYSEDEKIAMLQEFAAAYLQLRNTVPLAAVVLQNPSGGAAMDAIRAHEMGVRVVPADDLRRALWKHLDVRAVGLLSTAGVEAKKAPGIDASLMADNDVDAERKLRVANVLRDHLITMQASYPNSFTHAQLGSLNSVRAYLRTIAATAEGQSFPPRWVNPIATAVRTGALPALPAHPGRAANMVIKDVGKSFAVQLATGVVNGHVVVTDIHVGGRPRGVFGTGGPGSHTTAWSVYEDRVAACMRGLRLGPARTALVALGGSVRDPDQERVDAMDQRAQDSLQAAQQDYDDAVALAAPAPALMRLQAIARAVLMLLNTGPLSAIQSGGMANPALEGQHRQAVRAANVPGPNLAGNARFTLIDHLWGLLDIGTLAVLVDEDSPEAELPGAVEDESGASRVAFVIEHHLTTLRGAYPYASTRASIDDLDALLRLLLNPRLRPPAYEICRIAAALGHRRSDAAAMLANMTRRSAKRKRSASQSGSGPKGKKARDDDDYVFTGS